LQYRPGEHSFTEIHGVSGEAAPPKKAESRDPVTSGIVGLTS
jgi:hypothetical protein